MMDLFSRSLVGWSMDNHLRAELVILTQLPTNT